MGKEKKVSFGVSVDKSLVRNLRIQANLEGINPSRFTENILLKNIGNFYNFVMDDEIFNLPSLKGSKESVLSIWVKQLNNPTLFLKEGQLKLKEKTLCVEDLEEKMTPQKFLDLKETLYNFIYPEGISQDNFLDENKLKEILLECGVEDFYKIITDPHGNFFFIFPERKCVLKKVVEVNRKDSSDTAELKIREMIEEKE